MTDESRYELAAEKFLITNLDVLEISASYNGSAEPHVTWWLGYAPEREENKGRVIFGQLHSGSPAATGHVMVSALFFDTPGSGETDVDSDIESVLAASIASETLYDYARTALAATLGIIEASVALPRESPIPEVSQLVRRANDQDPPEDDEGPSQN